MFLVILLSFIIVDMETKVFTLKVTSCLDSDLVKVFVVCFPGGSISRVFYSLFSAKEHVAFLRKSGVRAAYIVESELVLKRSLL